MNDRRLNSVSEYNPELLAQRLLQDNAGALLLFGESGSGKSTLASWLANRLSSDVTHRGLPCYCLGADPGFPSFGIPGAVCLGVWRDDGWLLVDFEPLCSLDAVRYRLPLVMAATRLISRLQTGYPSGRLIVDAPGVVAGAAGEELLSALLTIASVKQVCYLTTEPQPRLMSVLYPPLIYEGITVDAMAPSPEACRYNKSQRARARTELWRAFMSEAEEQIVSLSVLSLLGTASGIHEAENWRGRQIALLQGQSVLGMGEVLSREEDNLQLKLVKRAHLGLNSLGSNFADSYPTGSNSIANADRLLLRDAVLSASGLLRTEHFSEITGLHRAGLNVNVISSNGNGGYNPSNPRSGEPVSVRLGIATATMINGIFGDPLLHVHLHNQRRHLLFDLGEAARLPTRVIHQTTDIFLSHTHADHIGGFLWLLRSRIGYYPCCRVFGPPGIAQKIFGLVNGLLWDRAEDRAPQFEILELHQNILKRWMVIAGEEALQLLPERKVLSNIVLEDSAFSVKAVTLEHGMPAQAGFNASANQQVTPVLAYALELSPRFNVCKEKLSRFEAAPGSWLQTLKHSLERGDKNAVIELPNGKGESVKHLAQRLLIMGAGEKLVYATDLADIDVNREKLVGLAKDADVLFCESPYCLRDRELAQANGHLTTQACGEIATLAEAKKLVPFHFSKRYEKEPEAVYDEIQLACSQLSRHQREGDISIATGG